MSISGFTLIRSHYYERISRSEVIVSQQKMDTEFGSTKL